MNKIQRVIWEKNVAYEDIDELGLKPGINVIVVVVGLWYEAEFPFHQNTLFWFLNHVQIVTSDTNTPTPTPTPTPFQKYHWLLGGFNWILSYHSISFFSVLLIIIGLGIYGCKGGRRPTPYATAMLVCGALMATLGGSFGVLDILDYWTSFMTSCIIVDMYVTLWVTVTSHGIANHYIRRASLRVMCYL